MTNQMKLSTLLSRVGIKVPRKYAGYQIDTVCYDSRMCSRDTLFVCIRGAVTDGHLYAKNAYDRGCRAFLCEEKIDLPDDAAVIVCNNTRQMLALVSAELYGRPADSMRLIGITGTKGKTTTCLLIYSILNAAGIPTGYIGTVGVMYAGRRTSTLRSTPESADLHQYFYNMKQAGITTVVMEVSSQAVYMDRIYGLTFDACAFTNLSPDHIGGNEHPTFEHYRDCKARLLSDYGTSFVVYNADDENAAYMVKNVTALTASVSIKHTADYCADNISNWRENGGLGVSFTLHAGDVERRIRLRTPGDFSVYNALVAVAICRRCGVPYVAIASSLSETAPLGRFEVVNASIPYATFVIDYAHNELSLRSALSVLREYKPHRLVVLVGSVGGRTFSRRAPIGAAISELADFCILTADDPDFEDPMDIIHDILDGFGDRDTPFVCIPDRREAVRYAVEHVEPGDIVLFAGKGHENFILINGEHVPFSERSIIIEAAAELKEKV